MSEHTTEDAYITGSITYDQKLLRLQMCRQGVFLASVIDPGFASSKVAAAAIFDFVTGDCLPCDTESRNARATIFFALSSQSPDMPLDLQRLNGRPDNKTFEAF